MVESRWKCLSVFLYKCHETWKLRFFSTKPLTEKYYFWSLARQLSTCPLRSTDVCYIIGRGKWAPRAIKLCLMAIKLNACAISTPDLSKLVEFDHHHLFTGYKSSESNVDNWIVTFIKINDYLHIKPLEIVISLYRCSGNCLRCFVITTVK